MEASSRSTGQKKIVPLFLSAYLYATAAALHAYVDLDGRIWANATAYPDWDAFRVADHTNEHKCGRNRLSRVRGGEGRRRRLLQSDCGSNFNNPSDVYAPATGSVYRVQTVIHVIHQGSGSAGYIDEACVRSGITMLNNDFRAVEGTTGGNSVDTRIEFELATTDAEGNDATG